jgi:hypothetical protein
MRAGMTTQVVNLRAIFVNVEDELVSPDADPVLYIYDSSFTREDIQAEIDSSTFTGLGPFTATEISAGYYEYDYTIPSGGASGVWRDVWISSKDGVTSSSIFEFDVITQFEAILQGLEDNQLVIVELAETIADLEGNALEGVTELTFTTSYDPLFASADLIRVEVGRWIDFIPDDTLNLMAHWSSKEAELVIPAELRATVTMGYWDGTVQINANTTGSVNQNRQKDMLALALTKFVIYDAALRSLKLPGAAEAANVTQAGMMKRLGDLMIQGPQSAGLGGSGLTQGMLDDLRKEREKWWRVVNSGGRLTPGQSYDPAMGVRGILDPDRRRTGRQVEDIQPWEMTQPAAGRKERIPGRRKHRFMGSY